MSVKSCQLSASQLARRARILDAAQQLFGQMGVRATTMEAIAKAASIAKPTLYAYFADKEEVLHAVAMRIAQQMQLSAEQAFTAPIDAIERIIQALQARIEQIYDLVIGSPYAEELYAIKRDAIMERYTEVTAFCQQCIAAEIDSIPTKQGQGEALSSLIMRACDGLKHGAASKAQLHQDIAILVRGVLRV